MAATAAAVASACNSPVEIIPPKITALKAYYCAVPGQASCLSRGDPIPAGTLPPSNEAFQVWAFYQGWITTHFKTVISDSVPLDSTWTVPDKFTPDSSSVWINLRGAAAPHYTLHVQIVSGNGAAARFLTDDSLRWDYHP
jgi:hypothetical protein